MPDLTWPTIETPLVAALRAVAPTYTESPDKLADLVPIILLTQTSGGGESGEVDLNPRADIDIIAAERSQVLDLIPLVTAALKGLECSAAAGVYFDEVRIVEDFGMLPYPNLGLRRANGLIEFTIRPQ
jgi:hypothetical protein